MADDSGLWQHNSPTPRPRATVRAEQERHDRALTRGLAIFFAALFGGGALAIFIVMGPFLRGAPGLQSVLVALVFVLPLAAAALVLLRVPPPPMESLYREAAKFTIDRRQAQRRMILIMQIVCIGVFALQASLFQRLAHMHNPIFVLAGILPTLFIVAQGVAALYLRGGASDGSAVDDEVTDSFRHRAQRFGYLLLLTLLAALATLAQFNAALAVRALPLGAALGVMLPVLYFVYLDWQASRSG